RRAAPRPAARRDRGARRRGVPAVSEHAAMTLTAGLAIAICSAVALNWGWVAQHRAASALPPLSLRRPLASLQALFATTAWLVGFVTGIGGWALYVAAVALAPLSLVQAV